MKLLILKKLKQYAKLNNNSLNGVVYRYIKNLQGDIVAIYQGDTKVAEYAYDAWGNHKVFNPDGTENTDEYFIGNINAIRYRGYYYDVETGLYYLMTRYYDPTRGRFISPDNVSYLDPATIQGLNLFAYCGNNPVMGIDPEGTLGIFLTLLIATIVGAVISAALDVVEQVIENKGDFSTIDWKKVGSSALVGAATGLAYGVGGVVGAAVRGAVTLSSIATKALIISAVAVNATVGMGAYAIEKASTEDFNPAIMALNGITQAGKGLFNVLIGGAFSASGVWNIGNPKQSFAVAAGGSFFGRLVTRSISNLIFDKLFDNWRF